MSSHNKPNSSASKKNLGGGKNFKKQGSKGRRGERQNQETSAAFVDDIMSGDIPTDVVVARVTKMFGGGRTQLLLPDGTTQIAAIRGSLIVSAGAARAPGNELAITANSFVLLHVSDYGTQIASILSRAQIHQIKDKIKASRDFFAIGELTEDDDGFDWDVAEEGGEKPVAEEVVEKKNNNVEEELDIEGI